MNPASTPARLSMTQVLVCGALIVTLSMGIRHGFGLWLQPITMDRGWSRETFAFALAVQNLAWGLAGPLAGMWAAHPGAILMHAVCRKTTPIPCLHLMCRYWKRAMWMRGYAFAWRNSANPSPLCGNC